MKRNGLQTFTPFTLPPDVVAAFLKYSSYSSSLAPSQEIKVKGVLSPLSPLFILKFLVTLGAVAIRWWNDSVCSVRKVSGGGE